MEQSSRFWPLVTSQKGTSCRNWSTKERLHVVLINETTGIRTWPQHRLSEAQVRYGELEGQRQCPLSLATTTLAQSSDSIRFLLEKWLPMESWFGWKNILQFTDLVEVHYILSCLLKIHILNWGFHKCVWFCCTVPMLVWIFIFLSRMHRFFTWSLCYF